MFRIRSVLRLTVVVAGILVWDHYTQRRAAEREEQMEVPTEVDPFADGYPVPPLPGQKLVEPRRAVGAAPPVTAARGTAETDTTPEDRRG